MQPALVVENVGKYFKRKRLNRAHTFMEAALAGFSGGSDAERFWALQDISFSVIPGEMLGVLGRNGAGKSTLLQLLGGIGRPDTGRIVVNAKIGGVLDLGVGFHSDLTGRENILTAGQVAGLSRREVKRRLDDIIEFAELAPFIDAPFRTYSSGMKVRLGFSLAVHTDPELLLMDEYLAVGDMRFQTKCLERIQQLKRDGCAIVFISQNPNQVQALCDNALWLSDGQVQSYGPAEFVGRQYKEFVHEQIRAAQSALPSEETLVPESLLQITRVILLPGTQLRSGDSLCIEIHYWNPQPILDPVFSVRICNDRGEVCFSRNTKPVNLTLPDVQGKGVIKLYIQRLDLSAGNYMANVGIHSQDWACTYDYHANLYPFSVEADWQFKGMLNPPYEWAIPDGERDQHLSN